jgi:DNA-binding transcriptional ArsR family regulator
MRTQYLKGLPEHWKPIAAVFAALGDETRQKILFLFEPGEELSIKDVAACFAFGRTTIVHHLGILEKAGILTARRLGRLSLYSLRHRTVLDALEKLRLFIADDMHDKCARKSGTDLRENR